MGYPEEYLGWPDDQTNAATWGVDLADDDGWDRYLDAMAQAGTSPNGVFGLKLHGDQAFRLGFLPIGDAITHDSSGVSLGACPINKFVHLRRQDKVSAAISEWRASQTNQWVLLPGEAVAPHEASPSNDDISMLHEHQHMWDRFWLGTRLRWEDRLELWFSEVTTDLDRSVAAVASFVGVKSAVIDHSRLPIRQQDSERENLVDRWVDATGGCHECGVT